MFGQASPISITELVRLISERRDRGERSSLFLGSHAGGLFGNQTFYDNVKGYSLLAFDQLSEVDKFQEAHKLLKTHFTKEETYTILGNALQNITYREEDELLAELVKAKLFSTVVSTNFDSLLEDTFVLNGMRRPNDYLILNGLDNIRKSLNQAESNCIMIKVFGDRGSLHYRTPVDDFNLDGRRSLKQFLKKILSHNALIFGYDYLWDEPLVQVFSTQEKIYYVEETLPPTNSKITSVIDKSKGKYLVGLSYQRCVREIHEHVIGKSARTKPRRTAPLPEIKPLVSATEPSTTKEKQTIFVSYSHKDEHYLQRFRDHIAPYLRNEQDLLEFWDDSKIKGGDIWHEKITNAIATARVAVLLISIDFFASDYIVNHELPLLLEAARTGRIIILQVIISRSSYDIPEMLRYQAMNVHSFPMVEMNEREQDSVWAKTARRIYEITTKE